MYTQVPDYDDFRGFYMPSETDLAVIPKRVSEGSAKPSWLPLKHHLFATHMPKRSFKAIGEIYLNDKTDGLKRERLFQRAAKIPISKTPI